MSKSDRSTYDFSDIAAGTFDGITPHYRSWNSYLSLLDRPLDTYLDHDLSRHSDYRTYTHDMQVIAEPSA